jgi:hypothetical protein
MNPTEPTAAEILPNRRQAFVFFGKAWAFRFLRAAREWSARPPRFSRSAILGEAPVLAESRSPLYASALVAEFALQAGKVQNLRVVARHLNGLVLRAGEVFSFWRHVPRPTRARGFALGRELREGCVIPSIGGGLCQISNMLYDVALTAGFAIVERHAHSRRLPGSMAETGRDATIFWNYVDLRFRAPADCQIEVVIEQTEIVVRLRGITAAVASTAVPATAPASTAPLAGEPAESCETCGVASCFRHPSASSLPRESPVAWLVDAWWPEHDAYLASERRPADSLLVPLDSRRWHVGPYRWDSRDFAAVRHAPWFVLRRSLKSRRLATQGAARQRALLEMDAELARIYARRIPHLATHLVVAQNLLPWLWREGVLAGRTFDVLMTRLPLAALEARLNRAAERWPDAKTAGDFRAPASLVADEEAALALAQHWITPHSAISALAGERAVKLEWHLPSQRAATAPPGKRIVFPASTLARKGALELRAVVRKHGFALSLAGPVLESRDFWTGCDTRPAGQDWLSDAAVVVLPSWVENQPRRLLAAIAAGVPVIASEACGLAGMAGVQTVPEGCEDSVSTALCEALGRH